MSSENISEKTIAPGNTAGMRAGHAAQPTVVIIGGGFGGLHAAKALANKKVNVILIDQRNYHTFQPLLYQVALSMLSPGEICSPLRHILRDSRNTQTILEKAVGFDLAAKKVRLGDEAQVQYDFLVVATGARHAYFGHDEWEKDAPGLKTIEDAVGIRRRLLLAFEKAERHALLTGERVAPTFAVIGGGPTGVELAGAIADLARYQLAQDFKAIDTKEAHVKLFEARRREFAAKWRFNRTVRWIVTYPAAVRAARYSAAILPQLLRHAIRYAGDVHAA